LECEDIKAIIIRFETRHRDGIGNWRAQISGDHVHEYGWIHRLTQRDESLALKMLRKHNQLLKPIFSLYGGREIKTMVDAFLIEFDSAVEATKCAVEMQGALQKHNDSTEVKLLLRIGTHVGDAIHRKKDLLGDAVNIASRIVPLAQGGDVCISEQVYDQVRNKISLPLRQLESRDLKNVTFPIRVYKMQLPMGSGQDKVQGRACQTLGQRDQEEAREGKNN
jgi:class 3 adenylate cyclase